MRRKKKRGKEKCEKEKISEFFFSSRRRHTRCALVIGVQTCALPILDAELRGRPFICGKTPTVADMAAYAYIAHAPEGGISLEPYPNIRAWLKNVEALPGFIPMPKSKAGLWEIGRAHV